MQQTIDNSQDDHRPLQLPSAERRISLCGFNFNTIAFSSQVLSRFCQKGKLKNGRSIVFRTSESWEGELRIPIFSIYTYLL